MQIGLTLFEKIQFRNYILNDDGNLLKRLSAGNQVTLYSSPEMFEFLSLLLSRFGLESIRIICFPKIRENWLARFFGFFLRWGLSDTGTEVQFNALHERSKISFFGREIRRFVWKLSPLIQLLTPFLRYLYAKSILAESGLRQQIGITSELEVLFVTSITNLNEDIPLAILAKELRIPVLASTRSWDNLSIHGLMRFEPDRFLAHSDFMYSNAHTFHHFPKDKIHHFITPQYQERFLPELKPYDPVQPTKILYACMGLRSNPDEAHFVANLLSIFSKEPKNFIISVMQHPSATSVEIEELCKSFEVNCFVMDYLQKSSTEYFRKLLEFDVVICGGTSVALDSVFASIPVIGVGYEVTEVPYWTSALRCLDRRPHTRKLFEEVIAAIAESPANLRKLIVKYSEIRSLQERQKRDHGIAFIGNSNGDMCGELMAAITESIENHRQRKRLCSRILRVWR